MTKEAVKAVYLKRSEVTRLVTLCAYRTDTQDLKALLENVRDGQWDTYEERLPRVHGGDI